MEREEPEERVAAPAVSLRRWLLIAMLLLFNLIDVVITRAVISFGGRESNPLMRPIIEDASTVLVVKVMACLAVGVLLMYSPARSRFAERAVAWVVLFYVVIAGWNIGVLLAQMPRS